MTDGNTWCGIEDLDAMPAFHRGSIVSPDSKRIAYDNGYLLTPDQMAYVESQIRESEQHLDSVMPALPTRGRGQWILTTHSRVFAA